MLILFDHGAPWGVARAHSDHTVVTAREKAWDRLNNGALLQAAEEAAFDLLLTTDRLCAHKVAEMDIPLLFKEGRRFSAGVVNKVAKPPHNAAKHPIFNKVRCAIICKVATRLY